MAVERLRDRQGKFAPGGKNDGTMAGGAAAAPKGSRRKSPSSRKPGAKWSKAKEATFFRELAMVCNVSAALRKAGLKGSSSAAYDRRKAEPRFRAAWAEAIDQSYAMLELEVLERTRFGDERPEPSSEGERRLREVPNGLALQLLKLHQNRGKGSAAAPAARPPRARGEEAALRREFDALLSEYNRRLGGEG